MTENVTITKTKASELSIQALVKTDYMIKQAEKALGAKAPQFLTSVLALANSSPEIAKCEPYSTYNACLTAATLDLAVNQNLGYAYIVPYAGKAQFQMGWRGFVQLAMRYGQYESLGAREVYEDELVGVDEFTGEPKFKFSLDKTGKIVGYMAYFVLLNGFKKAEYMSIEEIEKHAKKYSQTYKKYGSGQWKDNFDRMAKKTVLKLLLNRYAPLSIEMQTAIAEDQKVNDEYADNSIKNAFEVEDAKVILEEIKEKNGRN